MVARALAQEHNKYLIVRWLDPVGMVTTGHCATNEKGLFPSLCLGRLGPNRTNQVGTGDERWLLLSYPKI